jgi:hypothetical protein
MKNNYIIISVICVLLCITCITLGIMYSKAFYLGAVVFGFGAYIYTDYAIMDAKYRQKQAKLQAEKDGLTNSL